MSLFPAYVARGVEFGTRVEEYVPATGASEPFIVGDFVFVATGESGEVERCAADPTLIAGISEVDSEKAKLLTPNGQVPVRLILSPTCVIGLSSTTAPVQATHVGNEYGITRATGGQWQLDVAKTGASARCNVVSVDVASGTFFVHIQTSFLQFAAAS